MSGKGCMNESFFVQHFHSSSQPWISFITIRKTAKCEKKKTGSDSMILNQPAPAIPTEFSMLPQSTNASNNKSKNPEAQVIQLPWSKSRLLSWSVVLIQYTKVVFQSGLPFTRVNTSVSCGVRECFKCSANQHYRFELNDETMPEMAVNINRLASPRMCWPKMSSLSGVE